MPDPSLDSDNYPCGHCSSCGEEVSIEWRSTGELRIHYGFGESNNPPGKVREVEEPTFVHTYTGLERCDVDPTSAGVWARAWQEHGECPYCGQLTADGMDQLDHAWSQRLGHEGN